MPYLFTCPHCQTQTEVEDQYSGLSGRCVMCGQAIQVPAFARGEAVSRPAREVQTLRWIGAAVVGVLIFALLGFAALQYGGQGLQTMQENRQRAQGMRNLEQIAKALNAYAQDYGTYPPPTTLAADGTPKHSWRVLILPYLGYQTLYDEYRLEEPWNSAHNQELVYRMPSQYGSPAAVNVMGTETYYAMITGPGTLFPSQGPLGPADIADDPAQTLLLVEASAPLGTMLQWTEPADLDVTTLATPISSAIGGNHPGGATAVTADGRGHFLRSGLEPTVLKALISPSGGEGLPDDVLD